MGHPAITYDDDYQAHELSGEHEYELAEAGMAERLTAARRHARELLQIFGRGYSMPLARAEQLAQHLVALLGCEGCGAEFRDEDVRELECVRRHSCHANDCCERNDR